MLLAISATAADQLYAQEQADSEAKKPANVMEEVTVTARKRKETLQEAPVAISVLTPKLIEDAGVLNINDIGARLPNVSTIDEPPGVGGNAFTPAIRGMPTDSRQIGQESSLGMFIDGAYAGSNENGNRFLPPIERVEFLPGPQATLFGKNTTIGVLNIVTKKPGDRLEIEAHGEVGNNGHQDIGATVFFPLNSQWSAGLTAGWRSYSGYVRNQNPPLDELVWEGDYASGQLDGVVGPKMDAWGGNAQLAFRGDSLTFDLLLEYSDTERKHLIGAERIEGFDALPRDVISSSTESAQLNDERAATATIVKSFENGSELTSITNYRKFHTDWPSDDDSYFYKVVDIFNWVIDQEQTSQELRYSGQAGIMSYLVGGYWQKQDLYMLREANIWDITPNLGIEGAMENETTALFANADFDLTERWGAELGIRQSHETKDMPYFNIDISELGLWAGTLEGSISANNTSYTGALTFAPADRVNTHLRYSRGYKSGGFAQEFFTLPFEPPREAWEFGEEKADHWEMGLKWQATDSFWVNTALFLTDYTDLQVSQLISIPGLGTPFFSIGNADKARTKGIEVTAIYQGENLTVNGSLGYNKATFVEWLRPAGFNEDGSWIYEDMAGRELDTPRKTANLLADYRFDVGGHDLDLIGEYQYRDGTPAGPGEDPSLVSDSQDQINGRIRYHINENLTLTLWVRNLLDNRAIRDRGLNLQADLIAGGAGWYLPPEIGAGIYDQVTGAYQAPRHYGLTLDYRY